MAKFQQKYNEYAKMKKKKLLESIEVANKIIRGETTYEGKHNPFKFWTFLAESKRLENDDDIFQVYFE